MDSPEARIATRVRSCIRAWDLSGEQQTFAESGQREEG